MVQKLIMRLVSAVMTISIVWIKMLLSVTVDVLIMSMNTEKILVEMLLVYVNLLIPETVGIIAAVSKQFMVTLLMVLIQEFVNVLNI